MFLTSQKKFFLALSQRLLSSLHVAVGSFIPIYALPKQIPQYPSGLGPEEYHIS